VAPALFFLDISAFWAYIHEAKQGANIMAPRAGFKGNLKLELLNCAVALYPASTKADRISLNWLNSETGNRLNQVMVDSVTREPVEKEHRVKGYQVGKNEYLRVEDDELDNLKVEANKTIVITSFIRRDEVNPCYFDAPYWIVPDDKVGQEVFAVIRDSMRAKTMEGDPTLAALGTVVISRRERSILLWPQGNGIAAMTLHFPYEVRKADPYFADIPEMDVSRYMELGYKLVNSKIASFDPNTMVDHYEDAITDLIRKKQAGYVAPVVEEAPPAPKHITQKMEEILAASLKASTEFEAVRKHLPKKDEVTVPKAAPKSPRARKAENLRRALAR
jgi:DNA end-binding protein Ku